MPARPLIRVSCKMVADYMSSTPSKQRKTLAEYKYPDEDEATAKRVYYREARDAVRTYHSGTKSSEWLSEQGDKLADLAALAQRGPTRTRLNSNARTIADYAGHYSSAHIKELERFRGIVTYGRIQIKVTPDLVGIERSRKKFVRLEHGREEPTPRYAAVMCQLMYEAAMAAGLDLPTSAFVVRHIGGRKDFAAARKGARLLSDIDATCRNIEGIWETL
jgi:hypothetical protein